MKFHIDQEADALYIHLNESPVFESEEVAPGVILDFNTDKEVVGIEMLYLSKRQKKISTANLEIETVSA